MIVKDILTLNYAKGRKGVRPVDLLVIHVTEGNAASVRSWFHAQVASVSAHYMVRADGVIEQFVDEANTAWHAGRVDHPTADLVKARPGENPNAYSIGIEHEGTGKAPLTALQREASISLIRDICIRRCIPIDRKHIVGHREIFSLKSCPGKIDVDELVRLARGSV
jgi:N-acetyl-anhydromuramyl-L-alanine amidase AmpD